MTEKVIPLKINPGIQRDGTLFDAPCYVDGLWVRFQRGRPKKMGGYKAIFQNAAGISRGMVMNSSNGVNYITSGYSSGLQQWQTNNTNGTGFGPISYTLPGSFTSNAQNMWQFDIGYNSSGSGVNNLVAHAGQNLNDITANINTPVFTGPVTSTTLTKVGQFTIVSVTLNSTTTATVTPANLRIGSGQTITGTGIPANTTVVSATSTVTTTTVIMSQAATTTGTSSLTFDNQIAVSGGCVVLHPYLFVYGNDGFIQNSTAGDYNNWVGADANANNVSGGKIVKGLPIRGGSNSPAGLFWSSDALIRVSYSPRTVNGINFYWQYDLLTSMTSIMSSQSVIEYDGVYYWAGVDRFLMYNGVVQEITNQNNQNWFFDNINLAQRQKVWCTKVPRWGEIWWFYPHGTSTECNNAVIYNIREKVWYEAGLNADGAFRSAGIFSEVFPKPLWADNTVNTSGGYNIWQHEVGQDKINLSNQTAVQSYFETNSLGWVNGGPGQDAPVGDNKWVDIQRVEPDFVQSGDMNLYVNGKGYADGIDYSTGPYTYGPTTLKIDMKEQRRELRLKFESNTLGGDYLMGRVLISAEMGDERGTGNP